MDEPAAGVAAVTSMSVLFFLDGFGNSLLYWPATYLSSLADVKQPERAIREMAKARISSLGFVCKMCIWYVVSYEM